MRNFGISEGELQRIVDQYVIHEGSSVSLNNLRTAFKLAIEKNNEAIKKDIQKMIDEAVEQKLQNK
ncbi:MAG TPA: hypothetical protein VFJ73_02640 [Bacillales bacterium]|nr:hypothetical protein [Bacillales bacterium]